MKADHSGGRFRPDPASRTLSVPSVVLSRPNIRPIRGERTPHPANLRARRREPGHARPKSGRIGPIGPAQNQPPATGKRRKIGAKPGGIGATTAVFAPCGRASQDRLNQRPSTRRQNWKPFFQTLLFRQSRKADQQLATGRDGAWAMRQITPDSQTRAGRYLLLRQHETNPEP